MKNLSVEELAQELETSNHEKLIKALFLFEKSSSMEDLNSDQIEIILDEAIDKELCKKQEKSFER
ncbi:hypothetical protein P6E57_001461 [Campylobacter jejuni]|nr:hypothetical protein [Campylobacter jejuni]EKK5724833.1 hypothetical protein [Campylobacter jejuni]EKM3183238.1 hypothetical protein [Campylobacter jejuni]EKQ6164148.1 hypothetical protein [Campylobacter jejuni]ELE3136290.1 hypothetical protein [Campylobacter coli]